MDGISSRTRQNAGIVGLPERSDIESALGVAKTGKATAVEKVEFSKAEQALLRSNALDIEDSDIFASTITATGVGNDLVAPTYNPLQLESLVQQNNTLLQTVTALEVNIDGTGWTIERNDDQPMAEADNKAAKDLGDFLNEVYPHTSLTALRRKVRRDIESTGNGYIEIIRDSTGQIAMLRHMEAKLTRMVKLDLPVQVTKTMKRMGKDVTVTMWNRERRFAQAVGTSIVYFREYGASRKLDRKTGYWEGDPRSVADGVNSRNPGRNVGKDSDLPMDKGPKAGPKIPPEREASEVLHFTAIRDVLTNYGVPRWINQTPSILGSREAEVFNLEFFKHGGLPPAMVIVQNGTLDSQSKTALTNYLSGKAALKQRGILLEFASTSGDLNSSGLVRVNVERFGTERQQDSMFEKYDARCSTRVLGALRLPPLFIGASSDYNFATAYAAYMVAEAQVFKPERDAFDEVFNSTVMKELSPDYRLRSMPLSVNDVTQQIAGMTLVQQLVDPENLVDVMNEVTGLDLKAKDPDMLEQEALAQLGGVLGPEGKVVGQDPNPPVPPGTQKFPKTKPTGGQEKKIAATDTFSIIKMGDDVITSLAEDWSGHLSGDKSFSLDSVRTMSTVIKSMSAPVRKLFNSYVGMKMLPRQTLDQDGTMELLAAAGEALSEDDA